MTTARILPSAALAQGLCTFLHRAIFIPPSCRWVSALHGAHTERETHRVTLTELLGTCLRQDLPLCPPPALAWQGKPGRSLLLEAAAGYHGGNLTPDSALCIFKNIHLKTWHAHVLCLQTKATINNKMWTIFICFSCPSSKKKKKRLNFTSTCAGLFPGLKLVYGGGVTVHPDKSALHRYILNDRCLPIVSLFLTIRQTKFS